MAVEKTHRTGGMEEKAEEFEPQMTQMAADGWGVVERRSGSSWQGWAEAGGK